MLGTEKKSSVPEPFNEDLNVAAAAISQNAGIDREERFLQTAALVLNYRQCGATAMQQQEVTLPVAEKEEKTYCSTTALQLLKDILQQESNSLLYLWLNRCNEKGLLVTPRLVPPLLQKAEQQKNLRELIVQCCGKRGEWLARFNPAWNFASTLNDEELWQTGTPEQRRQVLQRIKITDAVKAGEWLRQTWPQENAAGKLELLKAFAVNLTSQDVEWLESLLTEKSQRIKEEALNQLKQIPSSGIVQQYQQVLQQAVVLKKEKALLGLSSKLVLQIQLPAAVDETIFTSGIEKLSSQSKITDEQHILQQLISHVPPDFWEAHFNEPPTQVLQIFEKEKATAFYVPAIAAATANFKNKNWAALIADTGSAYYPELLPLLDAPLRDKYLLKHFEKEAAEAVTFLSGTQQEWSLDITRALLQYTAKNTYQYNRSFYKEHIHLLPTQIGGELQQFAPKEEYLLNLWNNISEYIHKLLYLKYQAGQVF